MAGTHQTGLLDSVGIENIAKEKQINWDYSPTEVVSSDTLWYELKSKLGIITDNVPSCNILTVLRVGGFPGKTLL